MKKRYIILITGLIALFVVVGVPVAVGAVTASDALIGLKEFYVLLIELAKVGLDGYVTFLESLI